MRTWKGIIMPEDSAKPAPTSTTPPAADTEEPNENPSEDSILTNSGVVSDVVDKINEAHNILIALSSDPSVDEMAAAIGTSLFLDKLGKRTTAIYSGATPNALEFLKPEETFEPTVDALQDFVIALNKEKADHLRYKLDGDFVKIFITTYRTRIGEEDLDYSYGDFNIDLVLALDVANGIDLDAALREHGRIMHDAVIVNITNGNPGKLGEIEWSDKKASSVSEMLARLIYSMNTKAKIEKDEATAFLTGIVAATNRFSNAKTTPETMRISSKLMESGANQQLVSKNITASVENEMFNMSTDASLEEESDQTKLDISHGDEEEEQPEEETISVGEPDLLDDLKAAEESLAHTGAEATPEAVTKPLKIDREETAEPETVPEPVTEPVAEPVAEPAPEEPVTEPAAESTPKSISEPTTEPTPEPDSETPLVSEIPKEGLVSDKPEKVVQPAPDAFEAPLTAGSNKYGQMLEDALSSIETPTAAPVSSTPNPAAINAPAVPSNPEINGVPSMN